MGLAVILSVYLALGIAYALGTPLWQAPDEPAHYNYAHHIAVEGRLPVLEPGDYPAAYLEEIKAQRFPPHMPVESIRYEAHQPPAYYLLSAALLRLASPAPIATQLRLMRLLSVLLGGSALVLLAGLARRLFAGRGLALSAMALAAMTPMYIAVTAAANNDALAFVALTAVAYRLAAPAERRWSPQNGALLGLLVGLCAVIKFQAYVAVPLVAAALFWDALVERRLSWRQALLSSLLVVGVAAVLTLPWLARNVAVYGYGDPLGLVRHDAIVVGQLRTTDLIAEVGWRRYLLSFARSTFQSYWGQFGWMAAPLPERAYLGLAVVSLLGVTGLLAGWRGRPRTGAAAWRSVLLLSAWAALTATSFLWYNLQFVQFQGRYLFPALPALAIALAYGLAMTGRRPGWGLALLALVAAGLLAWGLARGDLPLYALALCAAAALTLLIIHRLPERWRWLMPLAVAAALAALSAYSLWGIIIPLLSP